MKIVKILLLSGILLILGFAAAGSFVWAYIVRDLPDVDQITSRQIIQSTKIYDRDESLVLYEIHGEEKRTIIPFEEIPQHLKDATVAIEDSGFFEHSAFDWRALIRALITNISRGEIVQGGSTITQQLAKNMFLSPEKTIWRKLKELSLSIELEKHYEKYELLNFYLNQIPYGANAYGVEAASRTFFGKSAEELTLAESAMLASLPRAPSYYSPWGLHADELKKRKDYILDRMFELGFIDDEERMRAKNEEIKLASPSSGTVKAPHFVMMVKDYLVSRYGEEMVEKGGLKIVTTLDWELQQIAEKTVKEGVERNSSLYEGNNGALVAQNATNGQILALVGSKDYFDRKNEGNFNVAVQGLRQPGSAFKPFAYITAFKKGYTPDTLIFDAETEFDTSGLPQKSYKPQNFDKKFRGPITMKEGLAQSINVPSVKTLYLAGVEDTIKTAESFGITTLKDRSRFGLSLVLGGGEVKLTELVGAYSVFAQEGIKHKQSFILKVEDSEGKTLEEFRDDSKRVIDAQYPRLINQILSDKELRRPLFSASLNLTVFPEREVVLKTGTTNDYVDAWALGYTPSLVVGVWAGNNHNESMKPQASSILAAVPMWHAFLSEALKKFPPETFNRPEPITYLSDKPILRGIIPSSGMHSILYYINKNNPWGSEPSDPFSDPQFQNWEQGVVEWLNKNPIRQLADQNQGSFSIFNISPDNGSFINNPFEIKASISSDIRLREVNLYLNASLIDQALPNQSGVYQYSHTIDNLSNLQNKIKIQAINDLGEITEKEIIIYK